MRVEDAIRERNTFLIGWAILILLNGLLKGELEGTADPVRQAVLRELYLWFFLVGKGIGVYLVYRLARFLGHTLGVLVLYVVLTLFSLLYLIPLIALWVDANRKIHELRQAHAQGEA